MLRKQYVFSITFLIIIMNLSSYVLAADLDKDVSHDIMCVGNTNKNFVTMAINEEIMLTRGTQVSISPPILVFDKTYVELYGVSKELNITVDWIEDSIGYFKISSNGNSVDFTLISQWGDLINQKYKFFVKESKIYVSLRELAELGGYVISYMDGIITIGNGVDYLYTEIYGDISTYDFDDYVYTTYPCWAEYVVNPYQVYSYETMLKDAERLYNMYPELIKISSIGKSVENRELLLLEFGRGKNKIFVCGTHHAREYIATTYLMYTIDRYAYAYRTNTLWGKYRPKDILDNVTFCIVPMVNPDGVNLVQNGIDSTQYANELSNMGIYEGSKYGYTAWKANVRGIDVNWNYDADWSAKRNKNPTGSTGFNGYYPNSEPETVAVSNYVDNNSFEAFLSFHTQGQIIYWADDENNPSYINQLIKKDTGFADYEDKCTGIGGSFFDYVYRNFKKPTITVELCPYVGNYPYPNNDFDTVWKPAKNILLVVGNEIIYKKLFN